MDNLLVSGDYPGLEDITGTERDRNGDLLVNMVHPGRPEMTTFRIQITSTR